MDEKNRVGVQKKLWGGGRGEDFLKILSFGPCRNLFFFVFFLFCRLCFFDVFVFLSIFDDVHQFSQTNYSLEIESG